MAKSLYPCIWFDHQAAEAAQRYCESIPASEKLMVTPMVATFSVAGRRMMGLNGGPHFTINPSISVMLHFEDQAELQDSWNQLVEGGSVLMPLGTYPWSACYGWLKDQFGFTWQFILGELPAPSDSIANPCLLFTGSQFGNAAAAREFYTRLIPDSMITHTDLYGSENPQWEGRLRFGQAMLLHQGFIFMDGPGEHAFAFNEAVSLVLECDTQEEIDFFWNALLDGGTAGQCGWLKDRFGISWQIIPAKLSQWMSNPASASKVAAAFRTMQKMELHILEAAANQVSE